MSDYFISEAEARQIIRREGEYWTLVFGGQICRLKDTSGLRHLAYLLRRPHQRIAALEIVTESSAMDPAGAIPVDEVAQERARVNVTRALSATLKRMQAHHPTLALHLRSTLRTGRFCTYSPDPRVAVTWEWENE